MDEFVESVIWHMELGISTDIQVLRLGTEIGSRDFDASCLSIDHLVLSIEWLSLSVCPTEGPRAPSRSGRGSESGCSREETIR